MYSDFHSIEVTLQENQCLASKYKFCRQCVSTVEVGEQWEMFGGMRRDVNGCEGMCYDTEEGDKPVEAFNTYHTLLSVGQNILSSDCRVAISGGKV